MKRELVNQSNDLIKAQYRLSLMSKKVFCKAVARLNPQGDSLTVNFNAKDYGKDFQSKDPNLPIKILDAARECMHVELRIVRPGNQIFCRVFDYVKIDDTTKEITVRFAEALKPELLDLRKNYTKYLVENIIDLSNPLHIRLYELLKSKFTMKEFKYDFFELCCDLGVPESYKNYAHFKQKLLIPAQRELKTHTDLAFDFKPIKTGRKVTKLEFTVFRSDKKMESEPPKPKQKKDNQVRRTPGYTEPKPNYQNADLDKYRDNRTPEEIEAAKQAMQAAKLGLSLATNKQ